jgi:hypothetical protein
MSSTDEGTWYELRPNGHPSVAVGNPPRWRQQAAAEQAAGQMRERYPDFRFVEIVSYEIREGSRSRVTAVSRV